MKRLLPVLFIFMPLAYVSAQFANDNVLYKAVHVTDLCKDLQKNPGYLLLDVRSQGEYHDTSSSTALNIGHLKGALNIDIRQVGARIEELEAWKNKPVYVYCSHSQRSRRVSKMLADSGFTNINNINGGLTALHLYDGPHKECIRAMMETHNAYSVISPSEFCRKLNAQPNSVFLLDVRPDSVWSRKTSNVRLNAYGSFKGTVNIPLNKLKERIGEIPKNKEILITDLSGGDAALAAKLLRENGFDRVSALLEGIDRMIGTRKAGNDCFAAMYIPAAKFEIIGSEAFGQLAEREKEIHLLDVRSIEEFTNRHTQTFRNIGHLKNAKHIPINELENRLSELELYQSKPLVVYYFGGGPEVFSAAETLVHHGFKRVYVLSGGIFNIRWTAANVAGASKLANWVVDVPEANR